MKNRIIKLCLLLTVLAVFCWNLLMRRPKSQTVQPKRERLPKKTTTSKTIMLPIAQH